MYEIVAVQLKKKISPPFCDLISVHNTKKTKKIKMEMKYKENQKIMGLSIDNDSIIVK